MILGDAVSKLKTFEPYFKVHNLVSVHHKSIILGQMTNLNSSAVNLDVAFEQYQMTKWIDLISDIARLTMFISQELVTNLFAAFYQYSLFCVETNIFFMPEDRWFEYPYSVRGIYKKIIKLNKHFNGTCSHTWSISNL